MTLTGLLTRTRVSAQAAGTYLLNELRTHAAMYRALKAMPGGLIGLRTTLLALPPSLMVWQRLTSDFAGAGGKDVMVGICHNVFWTEPKRGGPFYAHVRSVCMPHCPSHEHFVHVACKHCLCMDTIEMHWPRSRFMFCHRLAVACGNRVWGNETVMTYLKTGLYRYWLPPAGRIKWQARTSAHLLFVAHEVLHASCDSQHVLRMTSIAAAWAPV
jgi:hypothetical protein